MVNMLSSVDTLFRSMVECDSVEAVFQPVVSVKKKSMVGFETYFRGIHPFTGAKIPLKIPFVSSDAALNTQMDRLCRKKGMESYAAAPFNIKDKFLTLNFDPSMVIHGLTGFEQFLDQIVSFGIRPDQIVIKNIESNDDNLSDLFDLISVFKEHGFMVALDHIGSAVSSLESIVQIRADIVKISRLLVRDLDKEFYKQEILFSLIDLSHRAGSVVIADGVDNEALVSSCVELGVDFLQGNYFGKPSLLTLDALNHVHSQMKEIASKIRNQKVSSIIKEDTQKAGFENVVDSCIESAGELSPEWFEGEMEQLVAKNPAIECPLYFG